MGLFSNLFSPAQKQPSPSTGVYYGLGQNATPAKPNLYNPKTQIYSSNPNVNYSSAQKSGITTKPSILLNTSGEPGGGQVLGASTGSSGTVNLTAPTYDTNQQGDQAQINLLRQQYGNTRSAIEAQNPQLDQTYNLAKGDIEGSISETEKAATAQKEDQNKLYGNVLRNQLQTYQDLNRQRMGTFSALGSLDSSEFQNQQFRGDQAYGEQRGQTEQEQVKTVKQIDDSVVNYKKQATSELARIALQYQQGKQAIQTALSQNNLQEASAIQSAMEQMKQQAQEIQNNIISFANQAQLLKAQGMDVRTNIAGANGNEYAQYVNNLLAQQSNAGKSMYSLPTSGVQGAGYIGTGTTQDKKKSPFSIGLGV